MSSTIAIWSEDSGNNCIESNVRLNINLWSEHLNCRRCPWKKEAGVKFDLGLKFDLHERISWICLYFPFEVDICDIEDLGIRLASSEVSSAIFNENLSMTNSQDSNWVYAAKSGAPSFSILRIDRFEISRIAEGTKVAIKVPEITDESFRSLPIYIRIRFGKNVTSKLLTKYRPKNFIFISAFDIIELIDLRINAKRNLPRILTNDVKHYSKIDRVHFLCLRKSEDELLFSYHPVSTARILETKIWDGYYRLKKKAKGVAYHWKSNIEERNMEDFNILVKLKVPKNNIFTILLYLLGIIAISVLSNYAFEASKKIQTKTTQVQETTCVSEPNNK